MRTERFNDGSTRTMVTRADGTRIVTIRDSTGRALRRVRIDPDGREYLMIDDTRTFEPVNVQELPSPAQDAYDYREASDAESLRLALLAAERRYIGRSFSLRQVREYAEVRALAPMINLQAITFATNSAALQPSQAEQLREMGLLMRELIAKDPTELFLVEGHTDAVGSAGYNLLLSDRRAESVALAFSEYFGVPTENMVVQGYGESFLQVPTQEAERVNRRVAVRRITRLLYR
ncbi:OmpA family protein [Thioclava sp. FR2]|uniref:OmpA family protein n=1 Tax=Thioclava sp. FR2 TaxID=3445780 RepID=UPI003EB740ED